MDDSRNSLKISIFTKEWSSVAWRQCKGNHSKKSHSWLPLCVFYIFFQIQIYLRLLDDCLVGTGGEPSNEVHVSIDVGEFHKNNNGGPSKGKHLCWFKWRQGPPVLNSTNFQLQILNFATCRYEKNGKKWEFFPKGGGASHIPTSFFSLLPKMVSFWWKPKQEQKNYW